MKAARIDFTTSPGFLAGRRPVGWIGKGPSIVVTQLGVHGFDEGSGEMELRSLHPGVALEQGIDRLLDYSIPARLRAVLRVGQLVKVPLGRNNKAAKGYVVGIREHSDYPKIKSVSGIEDEPFQRIAFLEFEKVEAVLRFILCRNHIAQSVDPLTV